jgi:tRNA-specific 2-thiouridylase
MGHYASIKRIGNRYLLTKSKDQDKDQTYFLCWLDQKQLSHSIFPLGNIDKNTVRQIAKEQGLTN